VNDIPDKDFKARHKASANYFVKKMQSSPELLIRSRNYEETFLNYCEESDKDIYKEIFK
jgi:hypothetical protein